MTYRNQINLHPLGQNIFLLFFCIFSFVANAQYTPIQASLELQSECSVYFASGNYELSPAAIKTLSEFLLEYDNSRQSEIRLQAFTDDVGSPQHNKDLAKQRAESVQNYLMGQGIVGKMIDIKPSEQLSLNSDEDAAEQRKKNRRVAVELWVMPIQTEVLEGSNAAINRFFENYREKATQYFSFKADKGEIIEGAKGIVLQIPPNCLVDRNGHLATGTILLELREANSYGDMLLQNLSTMSGNDMLETGGMFYLAAKSEDGGELFIREGAEIMAALPNEEAKLPDMQTFEGLLDASGNLDWVATQEAVVAVNRGMLLQEDYRLNPAYQVSHVAAAMERLDNTPVWKEKMQKVRTKPYFRKKAPKAPKLRVLIAPNKDKLKAMNPQRNNESTSDYKKRINDKYKSSQKTYRSQRFNNLTKQHNYRRDSVQYVRDLAKHEKEVEKYKIYNDKMRLVLKELYKNTVDFNIKEYAKSYEAMGAFFGTVAQYNDQMSATIIGMTKSAYAYEKEDYDMDDVLGKLQSLGFEKLTKEECAHLKKCWEKNHTKFSTERFYKHHKIGDKPYYARLNSQLYAIAKLYNNIPEEGEINPYQLRQIRRRKEIINSGYNFDWLTKVSNNAKKCYENRRGLILQFAAMEAKVEKMQHIFLDRKNELGLIEIEKLAATANNIQNSIVANPFARVYGMAMRVSRFGWSNCDKMIGPIRAIARAIGNIRMQIEENRMNNLETRSVEMAINAEETANTAIFVVFKDQKSIVRTIPTGKDSYLLGRAFKNARVKIVGLRIIGKETEMFVEEGTVAQLNGLKPVFKKKTAEEIEATMALL